MEKRVRGQRGGRKDKPLAYLSMWLFTAKSLDSVGALSSLQLSTSSFQVHGI